MHVLTDPIPTGTPAGRRNVRFLVPAALLTALFGLGTATPLSDGTAIGHNHTTLASGGTTDGDGTAMGVGRT